MILITKKDIIWNYLGLILSFGINILLLPIVLKYLSSQDLGMWYVFSSIGALVTLIDFGFAPQIARSITYAFSGASEISKSGISISTDRKATNYLLLSKVISASKLLYLILALIAVVSLLSIGTFYIYNVSKSRLSDQNLVAWIIYSLACFINIFYSYYNSLFKGIGAFQSLNIAVVYSKIVQFVISLLLLFLGYGLLAVSVAYFLSALVFRLYLSNAFRKEGVFSAMKSNVVGKFPFVEIKAMLKIMSHNASKDGLVTISNYLVIQSNIILCSIYFGLEKTASYGLTVQLLSFIASVSVIVFSTFQPLLVKASLNKDIKTKRKIYSISWVSYFFSFIILTLAVVFIGIPILALIKSNTDIELGVFVLYAVYLLIQTNTNISASFISTSNRLPYAFPFFLSAMFGVLLAIVLAIFTDYNVYGLIIGHLVIQLLYNAWKWPRSVFLDLDTGPKKMILTVYFILKQKLSSKIMSSKL